MGFFSDEMIPMLGVFQSETAELIESFDTAVNRVEQADSFTYEDVAELFRCTHTTKSSSAMMGLEDLSHLTHRVEDLFDILRGDPSLADGHVADILDHLYAYSDYVKDELGRMDSDDFAPTKVDDLVALISADIASLAGGEMAGGAQDPSGGEALAGEPHAELEAPPDSRNEPAAPSASEAPEASSPAAPDTARSDTPGATPDDIPENCATIKVSFKPDVAMVNARALVITKQIAGRISYLSYLPADLTDPESMEQINEGGLLLTVKADDVDAVKQLLATNSFIRRIVVLDEVAVDSPSGKAKTEKATEDRSAAESKFISLRWGSIHSLQNLAGELLLEMAHLRSAMNENSGENDIKPIVSTLSRYVDDLVYSVNSMAMVSISALVPQLSRMVRDMSRNTGKRISFEVHGGDIEIDRNLYSSISEPLLHIIRNSVDHGIEPPEERLAAGKEARGTITLSVESLGGRVVFRVSDDGRGIDTSKLIAKAAKKNLLEKSAEDYTHAEALMLIMKPGFSAAEEVTQYSGRGVGMDVVNNVMKEFEGHAEIESKLGQGTTISLFMPVSVTSIDCLRFRVGPYTCHLPLTNLDKIYTEDEAEPRISLFDDGMLFRHHKQELPVLDMHNVLGYAGENKFYIVCHSFDLHFAITADEVVGNFICTNKPLPTCLDQAWQTSSTIRNGTIMNDGAIGYTLSAALLSQLLLDGDAPDAPTAAAKPRLDNLRAIDSSSDLPGQLLVFKLGDCQFALSVDHIVRVVVAEPCTPIPRSMEHLIGLANFRNQIIPIVDLAHSLGATEEAGYYLIVALEDGRHQGLAVTSIVGVRTTDEAVLSDELFEPDTFVAGLTSVAKLALYPKDPPTILLEY